MTKSRGPNSNLEQEIDLLKVAYSSEHVEKNAVKIETLKCRANLGIRREKEQSTRRCSAMMKERGYELRIQEECFKLRIHQTAMKQVTAWE